MTESSDDSGRVPNRTTLLDATGRAVMSLRPGPNDVRHLAPGVYLCRTDPSSGPAAVKLTVVR